MNFEVPALNPALKENETDELGKGSASFIKAISIKPDIMDVIIFSVENSINIYALNFNRF